MVEEEVEPVRPEILGTQTQLAKLQIQNWLTFFALLRAKFEKKDEQHDHQARAPFIKHRPVAVKKQPPGKRGPESFSCALR